jgi:hypothetical protein
LQLARLELLDLADPEATTPPALAPIGQAIGHPNLTLRVFVETIGGRLAYDGWVDERTAVLHPELPPTEAATVVSGDRSMMPSLLASIVDLGIRSPPTPRHAIISTGDLRHALQHGRRVEGVGSVTCCWTLQWSAAGAAYEGITVIDQGPACPIWLARSVTDDQILAEDVGAIGVWTALGGLLRLTGRAVAS